MDKKILWELKFTDGTVESGELGGVTHAINEKGGMSKIANFNCKAYGVEADLSVSDRKFVVTNIHGLKRELEVPKEKNVELVYFVKTKTLMDASFSPIATTRFPNVGLKVPGTKNGACIVIDPQGFYKEVEC